MDANGDVLHGTFFHSPKTANHVPGAKKYRIPSFTVGGYLPTNAADAPNCKPPGWLQVHLRVPEIAP